MEDPSFIAVKEFVIVGGLATAASFVGLKVAVCCVVVVVVVLLYCCIVVLLHCDFIR